MSEGFRGAITSLTATTSTPGTYPQVARGSGPESDRVVRYSPNGHLSLRNGTNLTGFRFFGSALDLETARANSDYQILSGNYFNADLTLEPFLIDPRRYMISIRTAMGANRVWTLPSPANLIAYLKEVYGRAEIKPGFGWTVRLANDNGDILPTFTVTVTIPADYVIYGTGGGLFNQIVLNRGDVTALTFSIISVQAGQESILVVGEGQ